MCLASDLLLIWNLADTALYCDIGVRVFSCLPFVIVIVVSDVGDVVAVVISVFERKQEC